MLRRVLVYRRTGSPVVLTLAYAAVGQLEVLWMWLVPGGYFVHSDATPASAFVLAALFALFVFRRSRIAWLLGIFFSLLGVLPALALTFAETSGVDVAYLGQALLGMLAFAILTAPALDDWVWRRPQLVQGLVLRPAIPERSTSSL